METQTAPPAAPMTPVPPAVRDILFFGYYTKNTPYEQEYEKVREEFRKFGLHYRYKAVDNRGSWQKNTQMKAEVVRDVLREHPGRWLCYMDVDMEFIKRPDLLFTIDRKAHV